MNSIENEISKTVKHLLIQESFYGYFLLSLNKRLDSTIPTAGVSLEGINFYLTINPEYFSSLKNDKLKYGLLKHEVMHIALDHLTLRESFEDKIIFNIAADAELHSWFKDTNMIDDSWVTVESINKMYGTDLVPRAGTKDNYDKLISLKEKIKKDFPVDVHLSWGKFEKLTKQEKNLVKSQANYLLKEAQRGALKARGYIPGEMTDILNEIDREKPPIFNWKSQLRRFVANSFNIEVKSSVFKYNKYYPDSPGLLIREKPSIICAIDTSGSVSNKELEEFLKEIYHVKKTGIEVLVLEADTKITKKYKLKNIPDINISGRGGTDTKEVIDFYDKNRNKYSGLIYFTDGEIGIPIKSKNKMLWVLSEGNYNLKDFTWYTLKIPKKHEYTTNNILHPSTDNRNR